MLNFTAQQWKVIYLAKVSPCSLRTVVGDSVFEDSGDTMEELAGTLNGVIYLNVKKLNELRVEDVIGIISHEGLHILLCHYMLYSAFTLVNYNAFNATLVPLQSIFSLANSRVQTVLAKRQSNKPDDVMPEAAIQFLENIQEALTTTSCSKEHSIRLHPLLNIYADAIINSILRTDKAKDLNLGVINLDVENDIVKRTRKEHSLGAMVTQPDRALSFIILQIVEDIINNAPDIDSSMEDVEQFLGGSVYGENTNAPTQIEYVKSPAVAENDVDPNTALKEITDNSELELYYVPTTKSKNYWSLALSRFLISKYPKGNTERAVNRRSLSRDIYRFDNFSHTVPRRVIAGLDVSGSINRDMIQSFHSGFSDIMKQLNVENISLFSWSRALSETVSYPNPYAIPDECELPLMGGGTDFSMVVNKVQDIISSEDSIPTLLFVFTDMLFDHEAIDDIPENVEIIWVVFPSSYYPDLSLFKGLRGTFFSVT